MFSLKRSLLLLGPLTESVDHIRLMGATLNDALIRALIRALLYSLGLANLSAAYVVYLQFLNHLLTSHLWLSNVEFRLLLLAPPTD